MEFWEKKDKYNTVLRKNNWTIEANPLDPIMIRSCTKPTLKFLKKLKTWEPIELIIVGNPNNIFLGRDRNIFFKENIKIFQFDNDKNIIETWELHNPKISEISFGELTYLSDELVETVIRVTYSFATLNNKKILEEE